ncbi:EAL domain-containing protein [Paenibacillus sp. LHD-117]|uniref:putative bifunctional diguanylate cyclase/phosphodiesterase n=1 Tax=Paenibacillus sp. LHD-117 TaxID=3071412 RepID=UPI0027E05A09|nr:EAL domain-containing protein [Paenibacillus sp. LHD-117]MDQ6420139.1 EAL domain-containing protein [Paenibacillus sp. LHD-117]
MTNPHLLQRSQWLIVLLFGLLTLLAVLSESSKFQFIYGITFSFTSLVTLLALRLFGFWRGILIAAVAYTIGTQLLGQPLIHLIGVLEVAIVGLMLRRYPGRVFALDTVYWLLVGIPLTYAFYSNEYADGLVNIRLFVCILAINGLFNALFAEIIHQYSPKRLRRSGQHLPSTFSQILVHLALGIVMVSFMLNILVNSMNSFKEVSLYAQEQARQAIHAISQEWENSNARTPWSAQRTEQLQAAVDRYAPASFTISLVGNDSRVIASNRHSLWYMVLRPEADHAYVQITGNLKLSRPKEHFRNLLATTWQNEHFLYEERLLDGSGRFLVKVPLSNYQNYLYNKYDVHLLFLAVSSIVAAAFSLYIQRSVVRSLQRLAVSTTNLPLKLKQRNEPDWPRSSILEIHSLIANFKHMASNLSHLFNESQKSNERLQAQAQLLQQSEERLHQLAYYDMLTGLPNRLQFTRHFQELIDLSATTGSKQKIGVFFADINRFKQINDSLGHSAGDELLKQTADRFINYPGKKCDVFRLGGDEFVFIYAYREEEELVRGAKAIVGSFTEPFVIDGMPLFVTISVGISTYPKDGTDMDTVIRNADIAMYNAKEEGNGCYRFFKPSLAPLIQEKMQLDNGLIKALRENQFSLHYQPKMSATSGELCGIEALIRWTHPELGMIPPDKFIPLAEESGFILEIDNWVFREACRQNKAWQDAGLKKIAVSVNISARHFYQGNLKEMIMRGLADTGLEPQYVSLEITEGVFMRNMEQVIETILYLRGLGIQISIDDFGTGYSSLNQLQRLPISDVKLDRSFIQGITNDEKKSSIVKAIIELVHSMNMKVVAEGVETADESQFCKDLRCDELQGYLFSRPLPPDQLEALLRV